MLDAPLSASGSSITEIPVSCCQLVLFPSNHCGVWSGNNVARSHSSRHYTHALASCFYVYLLTKMRPDERAS